MRCAATRGPTGLIFIGVSGTGQCIHPVENETALLHGPRPFLYIGSTGLLDTQGRSLSHQHQKHVASLNRRRAGMRAGPTGVGEPDATIPTFPRAGPDGESRGVSRRGVSTALCNKGRPAGHGLLGRCERRRGCEGECEFEKMKERQRQRRLHVRTSEGARVSKADESQGPVRIESKHLGTEYRDGYCKYLGRYVSSHPASHRPGTSGRGAVDCRWVGNKVILPPLLCPFPHTRWPRYATAAR